MRLWRAELKLTWDDVPGKPTPPAKSTAGAAYIEDKALANEPRFFQHSLIHCVPGDL